MNGLEVEKVAVWLGKGLIGEGEELCSSQGKTSRS